MEKYFENDTLANDWFENVMNRIFWKMFRSQEDWIHMAGELGKGRNPMIKSAEEFYGSFNEAWNEAFSWLKGFGMQEALRVYAEDGIDFPHDLAEDYNDWMGFEPGDDGYVEGKDI